VVQKISISLKEWILLNVVGTTDNVSARIEELLIKGHLYEKENPIGPHQTKSNGVIGTLSGNLVQALLCGKLGQNAGSLADFEPLDSR
jgi:hypothetical protein